MANINGNGQNNTINGTSVADTINAKGGSDVVNAGAGNDYVDGGSGDDILNGEDGADELIGGDGSDRLNGGAGDDILNGGAGIDMADFSGGAAVRVDLSTGAATGQGKDTLSNIENVWGSSFSDTLKGNALANQLYGNAGNDTFIASLGIDLINGGDGLDSLSFAGSGAVTANLATGVYAFDAQNRGTITRVEQLSGGSFNDTLTGDGGDNRLDGGAGDDVLAGGGGNDNLWGGAGVDRLIADGGDDTMAGDYSWDGTRSAGVDIFEIRTNAHIVTITDFKLGVDKLDLTAFGFGTSNYWTGASVQAGSKTVMTLTGQGGEVVKINLDGVTQGQLMTVNDMIGGSASLIVPSPTYPMNGGNGLATIFVLNPTTGSQSITGFENGLDRLDITALSSWGGALHTNSNSDAVLHFESGAQVVEFTIVGMPYYLIDASDYIM